MTGRGLMIVGLLVALVGCAGEGDQPLPDAGAGDAVAADAGAETATSMCVDEAPCPADVVPASAGSFPSTACPGRACVVGGCSVWHCQLPDGRFCPAGLSADVDNDCDEPVTGVACAHYHDNHCVDQDAGG